MTAMVMMMTAIRPIVEIDQTTARADAGKREPHAGRDGEPPSKTANPVD
jgi:hypothetical protein